jgi:hypothetical protein
VLVNMALVLVRCDDEGGWCDLVVRRRRSTLLDMNLRISLIVDLIEEVELGNSARKVSWNHQILSVDVTTMSLRSYQQVPADSPALPDLLSSIYQH